MSILDYLSSTISPSDFLQNIWLVLISAPSARPTALTYLARRLPKLGPDDDITQIVGSDIGLMIRAFASCLEDSVVLVQRGILDLLVTSLRLDSAASPSLTAHDDRLLLMRAASGVVLRRDLSLSRRLYIWLTGSGETSESQIAFLREHALELLRTSLAAGLDADESQALRSLKVFTSLLDKWEIGLPLSEVLVLDTLRAFQRRGLADKSTVCSGALSPDSPDALTLAPSVSVADFARCTHGGRRARSFCHLATALSCGQERHRESDVRGERVLQWQGPLVTGLTKTLPSPVAR
jgi:hypothetical protein